MKPLIVAASSLFLITGEALAHPGLTAHPQVNGVFVHVAMHLLASAPIALTLYTVMRWFRKHIMPRR